ncbi:MAG: hypothetical protein CME65_06700 [Halobacteriovoraceae bacterium]|nr:hypothetical protein [Halobacteriovoraceae bacterium]
MWEYFFSFLFSSPFYKNYLNFFKLKKDLISGPFYLPLKQTLLFHLNHRSVLLMQAKSDSQKLENIYEVVARTSPLLLFYEFNCPHCSGLNVVSKDFKREVSRCSNSSCRRIIIITNIDQIK